MIYSLPREFLIHISTFIYGMDLVELVLTCQRMKQEVPYFWFTSFMDEHRKSLTPKPPKEIEINEFQDLVLSLEKDVFPSMLSFLSVLEEPDFKVGLQECSFCVLLLHTIRNVNYDSTKLGKHLRSAAMSYLSLGEFIKFNRISRSEGFMEDYFNVFWRDPSNAWKVIMLAAQSPFYESMVLLALQEWSIDGAILVLCEQFVNPIFFVELYETYTTVLASPLDPEERIKMKSYNDLQRVLKLAPIGFEMTRNASYRMSLYVAAKIISENPWESLEKIDTFTALNSKHRLFMKLLIDSSRWAWDHDPEAPVLQVSPRFQCYVTACEQEVRTFFFRAVSCFPEDLGQFASYEADECDLSAGEFYEHYGGLTLKELLRTAELPEII